MDDEGRGRVEENFRAELFPLNKFFKSLKLFIRLPSARPGNEGREITIPHICPFFYTTAI